MSIGDTQLSVPECNCTAREGPAFSLPHPINTVLKIEKQSCCHLPKEIFETPELKKVKELVVSHCEIQGLPENFTSHLDNLKSLSLERNQLLAFPENLSRLSFLERLIVSHNKLQDLSDDITGLVNLQHLNVSYNLISEISSCISSLKNLKYLILSNNSISTLSEGIGALVNLEYFDVSHNTLVMIPDSINELKRLTYLNLSNNSLSKIPDCLDLIKLHTFLLSHNKFSNIPDCIIFKLLSITILDIAHNHIMFFDTPPKCIGKLVKLDISNNIFHDIPRWLFSEKCRSLKELNISKNKNMIGTSEVSMYSKSGDKTGVSTTLKSLIASNCCFTSSSIEFLHGLKALEFLTLGNEVSLNGTKRHFGNILFTFPCKTLNTCTNMKYLDMNGVGLAELPDEVERLSAKLEVLIISNNELLRFPDGFCKLVTLTVLQVSNNELRALPSEFGLLTTLKELILDGNKLQLLPESFKKLTNLKVLDLYDNIFEEFPSVILTLTGIQALDLEYNCFNVTDLSEQSTGDFVPRYTILKGNLRAMKRHDAREDFKKPEYVEENISEKGDCGLENVSSDECEEWWQEETKVPEKVADNEKNEVEENWDESDGSDSTFDPHVMSRVPRQASYGPALLVYESVMTSDHFCPADNHSEPILQARKRLGPSEYVEGQFEDADV